MGRERLFAAGLAAATAMGGVAEARNQPTPEAAHVEKATGNYAGEANRIQKLMESDDEMDKAELLTAVAKLRKPEEVKRWIHSPEADALLRVLGGAIGFDDGSVYRLLRGVPKEQGWEAFGKLISDPTRRRQLVERAKRGAPLDEKDQPPDWLTQDPDQVKVANR